MDGVVRLERRGLFREVELLSLAFDGLGSVRGGEKSRWFCIFCLGSGEVLFIEVRSNSKGVKIEVGERSWVYLGCVEFEMVVVDSKELSEKNLGMRV